MEQLLSKVPQGQSLTLILIYISINELKEKKNKTETTTACRWHKCERSGGEKPHNGSFPDIVLF